MLFRRSLLLAIAPFALAPMAAAQDASSGPPPIVHNWTGFYVGLNAGATWANFRTNATQLVTPAGAINQIFASNIGTLATFDRSVLGFIGGGHGGFNWQINRFILGVEVDLQAVAGASKTTFGSLPVGAQANESTDRISLNALGTVRGRIGYLVMPQLHLYVTGGFAYGHTRVSIDQALVPNSITTPTWNAVSRQWQTGWTAGGGAEWMFAQRFSVRGEYFYYDLGSRNVGELRTIAGASNPFTLHSVRVRVNGHAARNGISYHF